MALQEAGGTEDVYAALHAAFRWQVPAEFNIAEVCCGRWAHERPDALAIAFESDSGCRAHYSYGQLQRAANRLSNALRRQGVQRGDRVAIVLPQRFETAVAHIAIQQLGAVAMPLSMLFGPEALEYRLQDSGAVLALVECAALPALRGVRERCPALRRLIVVGECGAEGEDEIGWMAALQAEDARFTAVKTKAEEAAILIYTSGTTGPPKGALLPQRALIGNLSGFVASQNWFGFDPFDPGKPSEAVFWSPADWAWTGGLMDALLPTLYFGRPIVAYQGRFAPDKAFELMQSHGVTHSFLFPTALKAMMKALPRPREQYPTLRLQAIMSAGEAVGDAVFAYCEQELGITVNEMFGQTEINYIVGNCSRLWPARPGSMGRAYPGHRVAVIDDEGKPCPPGVAGDVAVHRRDVHGAPDPIFFLGYWNRPDATRAKFSGDPGQAPGQAQALAAPQGGEQGLGLPGALPDSWCRTGDMAVQDTDGYLWYQGRSDDVFKAAGYRIGPSEIENCLIKHAAVANAAVVPKPDAERGALVKAYIVLAPGFEGTKALVAELQAHVKDRLAPYEYPKEIEFIEALPMTTTGKLQRRVLRLQEEERARARGVLA
ncbi:acyl-CoA synthetase [Roseateles violae]|uniref:AMP-binding protein n=1 Tax=Roseateles violae TaxID=3058042 RepID=A0ABT8DWU4_9BURK|nr:AMP-binding protein [Pelomonas sp. PFR6]MDN3920746.1 AMP-binding protein [Pelomonas sp. PFR6]